MDTLWYPNKLYLIAGKYLKSAFQIIWHGFFPVTLEFNQGLFWKCASWNCEKNGTEVHEPFIRQYQKYFKKSLLPPRHQPINWKF